MSRLSLAKRGRGKGKQKEKICKSQRREARMEVLKGQVKKALVDDDTRRRGKKKDVGNVHQLKKSAKMRKCRKKL